MGLLRWEQFYWNKMHWRIKQWGDRNDDDNVAVMVISKQSVLKGFDSFSTVRCSLWVADNVTNWGEDDHVYVSTSNDLSLVWIEWRLALALIWKGEDRPVEEYDCTSLCWLGQGSIVSLSEGHSQNVLSCHIELQGGSEGEEWWVQCMIHEIWGMTSGSTCSYRYPFTTWCLLLMVRYRRYLVLLDWNELQMKVERST